MNDLATYDFFHDIDRLKLAPLTDVSQVADWVAEHKRRLNTLLDRKGYGLRYGEGEVQQLLADSIMNQVTVPALRKELNWMCVHHGYTLQTIFYYLDMVAVVNSVSAML